MGISTTESPKMRNVEVMNEGGDESTTWTLAEFLKLVEDARSAIPSECLGSAKVSIRGHGDNYASANIEIYYKRPETADEISARLARDKAWKNKMLEREHEEYARLKRKFENP